MSQPVLNQINTVRRNIRRMVLLHGLSLAAAALFAGIAIVGTLDYLFRFQDVGVRVLLTLFTLIGAGFVAFKFLISPLLVSLDDLSLALKIQQRYPELGDDLASSVTFMKQSLEDPTAGSLELRRAVIIRTTNKMEKLDLSKVLHSDSIRKAITLSTSFIVVLLFWLVIFFQPTSTAFARFWQPWAGPLWPQEHYLEFVNLEQKVAKTFPLEFKLRDKLGDLPNDLTIQFRYTEESGDVYEESFPMQAVESNLAVYRKELVLRPFSVRAFGGDDDSMDWSEVELVSPPELTSLEIQLQFPEYTGFSPQSSERYITAVKGTKVHFKGKSSKRLSQAVLRFEAADDVLATVSKDGLEFEVHYTLKESTRYWFVLTDEEEFQSPTERQYRIQVLPDNAPSVVIEQPKSNIFVTPDAVVDLQYVVKENLAIHKEHLSYSLNESEEKIRLLISEYEKPAKEDANMAEVSVNRSEFTWDIASLKLKPGDTVHYAVEATDFSPQTGASELRRLHIITANDLLERLTNRQTTILSQIANILRLQTDALKQVNSVRAHLKATEDVGKNEQDHLRNTELMQRRIQTGLTGDEEGVKSMIRGLLDDLKSNDIEDPDFEARMLELSDKISDLSKDHLSIVQSELTSSLKIIESKLSQEAEDKTKKADLTPLNTSLDLVSQHQTEAVSILTKMLAEWDDSRRFSLEISRIQREHKALETKSAELFPKAFSKELKDLDPNTKSELMKLAQQQKDLANELNRLANRMNQNISDKDQANKPTGSKEGKQLIQDVLNEMRKQGLSDQMRKASSAFEKNSLGEATQLQKKISKSLDDIAKTLNNRPEKDLTQLVKKLKDSQNELAELKRKQDELSNAFRKAERLTGQRKERELQRLALKQKQLAEDVARLSRQLKRLQAENASKSTQSAANNMEQASQGGNQEKSPLENALKKAKEDLEQAEKELAQQVAQKEADLAFEQLLKMQEKLVIVRDRQQSVVDELTRLILILDTEAEIPEAVKQSLTLLADNQLDVQAETDVLAKELESAAIFHLTLNNAVKEMQATADQVREEKISEETLSAAKNALRRLQQLIAALQNDTPPQPPKEQQSGGSGGKGTPPPNKDAVNLLSQLKLLKLMQLEINHRMKELEIKRIELGELTEAQIREFIRVSQEQSELAEQLKRMVEQVQKPAAAPEEELDNLNLQESLEN